MSEWMPFVVAAMPGVLTAGIAWGVLTSKVKRLEKDLEKQNRVWKELSGVNATLATLKNDVAWIKTTLENRP